MTAHGAHAAPSGPLQVLGMAALVLLPVMSIFGGIEFRAQLLAVLRKLEAAGRRVRRARPPVLAPHPGTHRSTERIHAGGRYTARMPRRDAPPLTEQAIIVQRPGRPWDTAANPVYRGDWNVRPGADVLADETPFPYDPAYDNCAGSPGCGDERVFFKWFGEQIACPRCYVNVFGGEPDARLVRKLPADVLAAELPQVIAL